MPLRPLFERGAACRLLCVAAVAFGLWAQVPPESPDSRQAQIAKLLDKAVSAKEPEDQIKFYREILQLDPNNSNAFAGLKEAQQKLEQQKKEKEEERSQREKAVAKASAEEHARQEAAEDVDRAVAAGDLSGAQAALETLRKYGPSPQLQRADAIVQGLANYRQRVKLAVAAVFVFVLGAGVIFVVSLFRKKVPYVQVVEGPSKGSHFSLEKDVTLIGSVPEYGDGKNDIVLTDEDSLISRCHCEIHKRDRRLYLLDCNSSNGTYLNGRRLPPEEPALLRRGSRIDLAGVCGLRLGFERSKK